jgi:hypothetical protein
MAFSGPHRPWPSRGSRYTGTGHSDPRGPSPGADVFRTGGCVLPAGWDAGLPDVAPESGAGFRPAAGPRTAPPLVPETAVREWEPRASLAGSLRADISAIGGKLSRVFPRGQPLPTAEPVPLIDRIAIEPVAP